MTNLSKPFGWANHNNASRNRYVPSVADTDQHHTAEGAIPFTPTFGAGQTFFDPASQKSGLSNPVSPARQDVPTGTVKLPHEPYQNTGNTQIKYTVTPTFDPQPFFDPGSQTEGLSNPTAPTRQPVPEINIPGETPAPFHGSGGNPASLDFAAVGPYAYPEFPMDSEKPSGYKGALRRGSSDAGPGYRAPGTPMDKSFPG